MFGTLEGWRAYAELRGDSRPADAQDVVASAALVRASDYIRHRYVANLIVPADTIPTTIEEATYVAASFELATPGFFSKTYTAAEQKVLTEVKGVKWTVTGKADGPYASAPVSSLIDAMFEPFIVIIDTSRPGFMLRSIGG